MTNHITTEYPIVNDYLNALRNIDNLNKTNKANSIEKRRQLREAANNLIYVMTAKAYKKALEIAKEENLSRE